MYKHIKVWHACSPLSNTLTDTPSTIIRRYRMLWMHNWNNRVTHNSSKDFHKPYIMSTQSIQSECHIATFLSNSNTITMYQCLLASILIQCLHKLVLLNVFWLVLLFNVPQTSLAQCFLASFIIKCPHKLVLLNVFWLVLLLNVHTN